MNAEKTIESEVNLISDKSEIRIDVYLSKVIKRSRSFCDNLIGENLVSVNDKSVKSSYKIKEGDNIRVLIPKEEVPDLTPKKIDFEVVYDCKDFAVINKPPGITVHPAPGNYDNTLVNGLMYHFNLQGFDDFRPGIVHRLDKDTSGLMIIAKHQVAREKLSGLFEKRLVKKYYLAICYGNPSWDEKEIESNMGRSLSDRKKMAILKNGRFSKSKVKVIWKAENIFLARVQIFTGRTHQIRLHMSHIGCPLIGDEVYGSKLSKKICFKRQALHSSILKFNNPFNNKKVSCKSELPGDMMKFLYKYNFKWHEKFLEINEK